MRSILPTTSLLLILSTKATTTTLFPARPSLSPHPFVPTDFQLNHPSRDPTRLCIVPGPTSNTSTSPSNTTITDSAPAILSAFQTCSPNGTVLLNATYTIASPLDLTFLAHVDVVLTGEVRFVGPVYDWAEKSFKYAFQNQSVFWKWGGEDVFLYGDAVAGDGRSGGLIDGNGQGWWEENVRNKSVSSRFLFWKGEVKQGLGVVVIIIASTDAFFFRRGEGRDDGEFTHEESTEYCVSFKPNSTNVVVQNLTCIGSHGISVGSLGQYANETDIVENLYIYNVSLANSSDGARIKVWPGIQTSFQTLLNGGGGLGRVRNVTYDLFRNVNNDRAITITQCYGQKNQTLCAEHPANLTIEDITIKNMYGSVSKKLDPQAGSLVCSAADRCDNIRVENITVRVPSGKPPVYECKNIDRSLLQINCTGET
ncbi:exopolygalacturonase [Paraphoma chrysanthemicola]|uniref:galacturonan 1,4-alpha-galacturonidase n=1 Tax=Paraphoma chrysanthemicola TaxID=798071 RepID=A0A8K0VUI5_9PLEO|nr:exopolygalacturonase [Paraphoma chrysanthemicola]